MYCPHLEVGLSPPTCVGVARIKVNNTREVVERFWQPEVSTLPPPCLGAGGAQSRGGQKGPQSRQPTFCPQAGMKIVPPALALLPFGGGTVQQLPETALPLLA